MGNRTSDKSQSTLQTYFHEISKRPLLTSEEEILLAQQVKQMMFILTAKEQLAVELKRTPTVEEWANYVKLEKQTLLQQLELGQKAEDKMITSNLRLVVKIAKKYQKRSLELLDLIQEGSLGLKRAVEKFDPSRGYKFSTYAYWWISQAIGRAVIQKGRTIRLPVRVYETLNKVKHTQHKLAQELGRLASIDEIAYALSLQPAKIREYLLLNCPTLSLHTKVALEQDTLLEDLIEDDRPSPESYLLKESDHQDITNLLRLLSPRQQVVLTLRFGWVDGREQTLAEIGERLSLSKERIRQIERQALTFLREQLLIYSSYTLCGN